MNFRLRTTKETGETLKNLHNATGLTPNLLSRLAISLSVTQEEQPNQVEPHREGLEFNRNTLTGDQDYFYKALIKQHAYTPFSEEEYFPSLFNDHLTRGVKLLNEEYKHSGNYAKLLNNLLKLGEDNFKEA